MPDYQYGSVPEELLIRLAMGKYVKVEFAYLEG
jgi:hypothetical protein